MMHGRKGNIRIMRAEIQRTADGKTGRHFRGVAKEKGVWHGELFETPYFHENEGFSENDAFIYLVKMAKALRWELEWKQTPD